MGNEELNLTNEVGHSQQFDPIRVAAALGWHSDSNQSAQDYLEPCMPILNVWYERFGLKQEDEPPTSVVVESCSTQFLDGRSKTLVKADMSIPGALSPVTVIQYFQRFLGSLYIEYSLPFQGLGNVGEKTLFYTYREVFLNSPYLAVPYTHSIMGNDDRLYVGRSQSRLERTESGNDFLSLQFGPELIVSKSLVESSLTDVNTTEGYYAFSEANPFVGSLKFNICFAKIAFIDDGVAALLFKETDISRPGRDKRHKRLRTRHSVMIAERHEERFTVKVEQEVMWGSNE